MRQCTRVYGYRIVSKEKYMKGEKYILYRLDEDQSLLGNDKPIEEKGSKIKSKTNNNQF